MFPDNHPYWHVRSLVKQRPEIASLSLSFYEYHPQTVDDMRTAWTMLREDFVDPLIMSEFVDSAPKNQECALHSIVKLVDGEVRHLVMVDMATSAKAHLEKLRAVMGNHLFATMAWYDSGRSFHGYGEDLLTEREWFRFMGLLLLANKPKLEPTVDPRWIGHRLLAGYSALRWTKNTKHYLLPPAALK